MSNSHIFFSIELGYKKPRSRQADNVTMSTSSAKALLFAKKMQHKNLGITGDMPMETAMVFLFHEKR